MNKLLFLLSIGITGFSSADYLDDWPDDALCSWMENPSPPSYMVSEVNKRALTCFGGIVIYPPPEIPPPPPNEDPPNPNPPNPKDHRPGWKIQEGSNFWVIDENDPYWQTETGSQQVERIKRLGSAYAVENPDVDPPIPSYYATDSCGEGKQPANSSC